MGLAMSGTLLSACNPKNREKTRASAKIDPNGMKVFWGDIHNHCNITYGHGDMRLAFEAAKQQLDFVAVTPHAMWPDIPGKNDPRLAWVIDYHVGAFKRLREGGYEKYLKMTEEYNQEGKFLTFPSYECHSMEHGDHVVLSYEQNFPLVECTSVEDLKKKLKDKKVFVTPHHMGYEKGSPRIQLGLLYRRRPDSICRDFLPARSGRERSGRLQLSARYGPPLLRRECIMRARERFQIRVYRLHRPACRLSGKL